MNSQTDKLTKLYDDLAHLELKASMSDALKDNQSKQSASSASSNTKS